MFVNNIVAGLPPPQNIPVSILHSVFIKGDMTGYELGDDDLEASQLYPDYDYTTNDKLCCTCTAVRRSSTLKKKMEYLFLANKER